VSTSCDGQFLLGYSDFGGASSIRDMSNVKIDRFAGGPVAVGHLYDPFSRGSVTAGATRINIEPVPCAAAVDGFTPVATTRSSSGDTIETLSITLRCNPHAQERMTTIRSTVGDTVSPDSVVCPKDGRTTITITKTIEFTNRDLFADFATFDIEVSDRSGSCTMRVPNSLNAVSIL
jgi:hypothetical protein